MARPTSDLARPRVSETALAQLDDARTLLADAREARASADRYSMAHRAALRATAAVLSVKARPTASRRLRSAWELLPAAAPELTEWASFFATTAVKRASAEAGVLHAVTPVEADALIHDVETFINTVEALLDIPSQPVLPIPLAG
ncbi:SAV_6107 family HEPN domain-containing protein [Bailinhaonella thermotolerans]|uniref:Chromosome segregation protein SMC n=1 Tax=Bailinhaonella thermotolerans TaxID=1070861 RepID=A0A3A4AZW0_9ACTN|nr:SAV_6107 family HEPN domain-containing protein [Bailinhaonella thermotolerans]RJL31373.1 chromosome segregation protein SMC [Bailinhaonella thermotolerans]